MEPRNTTHDVNNISLVVAGLEATGLASGSDAIQIEFDGDLVEVKDGARGDTQVSARHVRRAELMIKVLKADPFANHLWGLLQRQTDNFTGSGFVVSYQNGNTGLGFFSQDCRMMAIPTEQGGDEGQDALEFKVLMPHTKIEYPKNPADLLQFIS